MLESQRYIYYFFKMLKNVSKSTAETGEMAHHVSSDTIIMLIFVVPDFYKTLRMTCNNMVDPFRSPAP